MRSHTEVPNARLHTACHSFVRSRTARSKNNIVILAGVRRTFEKHAESDIVYRSARAIGKTNYNPGCTAFNANHLHGSRPTQTRLQSAALQSFVVLYSLQIWSLLILAAERRESFHDEKNIDAENDAKYDK